MTGFYNCGWVSQLLLLSVPPTAHQRLLILWTLTVWWVDSGRGGTTTEKLV